MKCFKSYSEVEADAAVVSWLLFLYAAAVLGWQVGWGEEFLEYMAGMLAVIPLHEAVHAAVLLAFGYKVEFGFSREGALPVAYTRPARPVEREKYLVFAAAPLAAMHLLLVWSIFGPLPAWARALYLWNTAGSSGDVLALLSTLRLPPGSMVRDRGPGFEECMPDPLPGAWRWALYVVAAAATVYVLAHGVFHYEVDYAFNLAPY